MQRLADREPLYPGRLDEHGIQMKSESGSANFRTPQKVDGHVTFKPQFPGYGLDDAKLRELESQSKLLIQLSTPGTSSRGVVEGDFEHMRRAAGGRGNIASRFDLEDIDPSQQRSPLGLAQQRRQRLKKLSPIGKHTIAPPGSLESGSQAQVGAEAVAFMREMAQGRQQGVAQVTRTSVSSTLRTNTSGGHSSAQSSGISRGSSRGQPPGTVSAAWTEEGGLVDVMQEESKKHVIAEKQVEGGIGDAGETKAGGVGTQSGEIEEEYALWARRYSMQEGGVAVPLQQRLAAEQYVVAKEPTLGGARAHAVTHGGGGNAGQATPSEQEASTPTRDKPTHNTHPTRKAQKAKGKAASKKRKQASSTTADKKQALRSAQRKKGGGAASQAAQSSGEVTDAHGRHGSAAASIQRRVRGVQARKVTKRRRFRKRVTEVDKAAKKIQRKVRSWGKPADETKAGGVGGVRERKVIAAASAEGRVANAAGGGGRVTGGRGKGRKGSSEETTRAGDDEDGAAKTIQRKWKKRKRRATRAAGGGMQADMQTKEVSVDSDTCPSPTQSNAAIAQRRQSEAKSEAIARRMEELKLLESAGKDERDAAETKAQQELKEKQEKREAQKKLNPAAEGAPPEDGGEADGGEVGVASEEHRRKEAAKKIGSSCLKSNRRLRGVKAVAAEQAKKHKVNWVVVERNQMPYVHEEMSLALIQDKLVGVEAGYKPGSDCAYNIEVILVKGRHKTREKQSMWYLRFEATPSANNKQPRGALPMVLLLSKEEVGQVLAKHDKLKGSEKALLVHDDKRRMVLDQLCDLLCVRPNPKCPSMLRPPLLLPTPPATAESIQAPQTTLAGAIPAWSPPQMSESSNMPSVEDEARKVDESLSKLSSELEKSDFIEMRSMGSPPAAVKMVIKALCLLLGVKPFMAVDPEHASKKVADYFTAALHGFMKDQKHLIADMKAFDKDSVSNKIIKQIDSLIKEPTFSTVEAVKKATASRVCLNMYLWVRALNNYYVAKMLAPAPAVRIAEVTKAAPIVQLSLEQQQAKKELDKRPETPSSAQMRPRMPRARVFCCCAQGLVLRVRIMEMPLRAGQCEHCVGALVLKDADTLAKTMQGKPAWFQLHHDISVDPLLAGTDAGEVLLALDIVKAAGKDELHLGVLASKGLTSASEEHAVIRKSTSHVHTTPGKLKCELYVDKTKLESTKGEHAEWGWAGTKDEQVRFQAGAHSATGVRIITQQHSETHQDPGWSVHWDDDTHTVGISDIIEQQKKKGRAGMHLDLAVLELLEPTPLRVVVASTGKGGKGVDNGEDKTLPWHQDLDTGDMTLSAAIKVPKHKRNEKPHKLHSHPAAGHAFDVWVTKEGTRTISFADLPVTKPASLALTSSPTTTAIRSSSPQVATTPKADGCKAPSEIPIETAVVVTSVPSNPVEVDPGNNPVEEAAVDLVESDKKQLALTEASASTAVMLELTLSAFSDAKEQVP
jgi:hypothetical protein